LYYRDEWGRINNLDDKGVKDEMKQSSTEGGIEDIKEQGKKTKQHKWRIKYCF